MVKTLIISVMVATGVVGQQHEEQALLTFRKGSLVDDDLSKPNVEGWDSEPDRLEEARKKLKVYEGKKTAAKKETVDLQDDLARCLASLRPDYFRPDFEPKQLLQRPSDSEEVQKVHAQIEQVYADLQEIEKMNGELKEDLRKCEEAKKCGENESFNPCGNHCESTCDDQQPSLCTAECRQPACECSRDYAREGTRCIPQEECGKFICEDDHFALVDEWRSKLDDLPGPGSLAEAHNKLKDYEGKKTKALKAQEQVQKNHEAWTARVEETCLSEEPGLLQVALEEECKGKVPIEYHEDIITGLKEQYDKQKVVYEEIQAVSAEIEEVAADLQGIRKRIGDMKRETVRLQVRFRKCKKSKN